ncbi:hypothetical protein GCM10010279_57940 [Streptomyces mutabilis]|nr:hypothetical protein GCM10010279_57940 [Streptomyces mutabilis]
MLPDETWVYPGHGEDTALGAERPHLPERVTRAGLVSPPTPRADRFPARRASARRSDAVRTPCRGFARTEKLRTLPARGDGTVNWRTSRAGRRARRGTCRRSPIPPSTGGPGALGGPARRIPQAWARPVPASTAIRSTPNT